MPAHKSKHLKESEYLRILNGQNEPKDCAGFIYIWRHRESGKGYVGKWEQCLWALCVRYYREVRSEYVKNRAIINALRCHGFDAFDLEILYVGNSREELFEAEKRFIETLKTKTIENGYNCTGGGDGGDTFSWQTEEVKKERRRKLSAAGLNKKQDWPEERKEHLRNCFKGRPIPQWQRDKIAATLRGRTLSDDRKKKQSETMKDMHLWNKVEFTEEQLTFIQKHIHKGKRTLAKMFNYRFNTSHSDAPFYRIKKSLKCQYITPSFFQNQS